jgi:hypothetical protein
LAVSNCKQLCDHDPNRDRLGTTQRNDVVVVWITNHVKNCEDEKENIHDYVYIGLADAGFFRLDHLNYNFSALLDPSSEYNLQKKRFD